jgi:5,5'-dehydrodivanillate O-demethylase
MRKAMSRTGAAAQRVPAAYSDFVHVGPGTLAGRYLRRFWHPVARAQDLPAGHAKPLRIMGEDFTLYRGEGGVPHVVAFRCAHRGTQLSTGWVEGDCIRCFYHGWKYDGTGQCVEQPAEDASFASKVKIQSYPTQEYLGLVFAYLGDAEGGETGTADPPALPRFPELEADGVLEVETFVRPCTYFNDLDNACDPLHVVYTHANSRAQINSLVDMANVGAEESEFGVTIKVQRTTKGAGTRLNLFGMPNIQLLKLAPADPVETAWRDFVSWRVPVDDEQYVTFNVNLFHVARDAAEAYRDQRTAVLARGMGAVAGLAREVLAGRAEIDDVRDQVWDLVRLQDDVALAGLGAIPEYEHEHLGRSDRGVILLRKVWTRELRALAEGRPLKEWRRPADLVATTGFESGGLQ